MKATLIRLSGSACAILCVAAFWALFFRLNAAVFPYVGHSHWADWIFLPAAVRFFAVLLLGWQGVVGLILGAWITLRPEDANSLSHATLLPLSSGLGPWVAIDMWRRLTGLREDLLGLRPADILGLALGCAVANSALLNLFLTLTGDSRQDVLQIATIIVGDAAGILLVLAPTALLLSLAKRQRPAR